MTLQRIAQTGSVVYAMYAYFFSGFTGYYVLYHFLWSDYWYLSLAYIWWMIYDNLYFLKGSSLRSDWFRKMRVWRWACEYFPIEVHITSRYDPQKTYICGYHPHGVMPNGAILGLSSNGINIDEKLPGIRISLCHLALLHWTPIIRECALFYGSTSVDRATIRGILSIPGNMLLIVVGGAAESLEGEHGKYRLILTRRKGFVREALITGACLVPVFSFGENYSLPIMKTETGSLLRKVQDFLKQITGATIPLIKGRSIFGIPIPVFPHRASINIVFGAPIEVTKSPNPTNEEIDELHARYMEELKRLFESNKARFEPNATLELI